MNDKNCQQKAPDDLSGKHPSANGNSAFMNFLLSIRKRWLFIGYIFGLIPIFVIWALAERNVLNQCIACYHLYDYSVGPDVCCNLEVNGFIRYIQIALVANIVYVLVLSGVVFVRRVGLSSTLPFSTAVRPFLYTLVAHLFLVLSALLAIFAIAVRATHQPFFWEGIEVVVCIGIIPNAAFFFMTWLFWRPVWGMGAILRTGIQKNWGTLVGIMILIPVWLVVSYGCFLLAFTFTGVLYFP